MFSSCFHKQTKIQRMNLRTDNDNRVALKSPSEDHLMGKGIKKTICIVLDRWASSKIAPTHSNFM